MKLVITRHQIHLELEANTKYTWVTHKTIINKSTSLDSAWIALLSVYCLVNIRCVNEAHD